jgi:hypothetical protein
MKSPLLFSALLLFFSTVSIAQATEGQSARKPMFSIEEGATKIKADDSQKSNNFKVYPIPTENILNLEGLMVGSTVDIMDLGGVVIMTFDINRTNQRIDISELAAGLYFFRLSFAGTILRTIRIVKD